ncbi:MAG: hypothetical protein KAI74_06690 [Kiritimatiellae bacterium]|nr:hypothetical protein [Kiritimatiellia bacterium]
MRLKQIILSTLAIILPSTVVLLASSNIHTTTNSNTEPPLAVSTNAIAEQTGAITEAEAFEGLKKEKLQEVTETAEIVSSLSSNEIAETDFDWDIHWDNGLRYQLIHKHPLWTVLYFGSKEQETKLDGKIGLKLDLDAMSYDESYSLPSSDEGIYIRRARLYTAGYFHYFSPTFYKLELEVADGEFFVREAFLWMDDIPYVQTVKLGHFKAPSTLDNMTSSRDRTFMESASPVEAFAQGLKLGIQISDSLKRQNATWALGWFGNGNESDINDASDSLTRLIWRATYLPIDNRKTHSLMHIGYSGSVVYTGDKNVQYRSRPESYLAPRLVDTGKIEAHNANIHGFELAVVQGTFSFQSEFLHSSVNTKEKQLDFFGTYGTWAWFLTGENRPYLRDTGVFGQVIPKKKFSPRDGNWGAWELAVRYSYLDLTDKDIDGGRMITGAAGINWYFTRNTSMKFNAGYSDVKGGLTPGNVLIAQTRFSINF